MDKAVPERSNTQEIIWGAAIPVLAGLILMIAFLSPEFHHELDDLKKPIIPLLALMMGAGGVYLFLMLSLKKIRLRRVAIILAITMGILIRVSMFSTTPILEDDHFRYLWDGGVLASGFNPYQYAPQDILEGDRNKVPESLLRLAQKSYPDLQYINYPRLKTIYPPITQAAFVFAHFISPWNLNAWRLFLLFVDVMTLFILFAVLRKLRLSSANLLIYWWNPLLIKEIYNSGHMDLILFPFLLGTLLLALRHKTIWASATLGLAVGVKLWPAILLPVILRPVIGNKTKLIPSLILFASLSLAACLPFLFSGLDQTSGLASYGRYWEMNDALFMILHRIIQSIYSLFSISVWHSQSLTRLLALALLMLWTILLIREDDPDPAAMCRRCLIVVAVLFFVSPTQFPWYSLWLLPFLAIQPRPSLLALTALIPLYYLRYYLHARDMTTIFDNGIVWLEYIPVWLLMMREWYAQMYSPQRHGVRRED
ncbi:glycosyltransferase 87 family protein [Thermodesulfobacteriota bacterium]